MYLLNLLPIAVTFFGGYMLLKLKAFFLFHPIRAMSELKRSLAGRGAVRALCLALAGTLGVGNIIGVAVGLIIGGAGSVFWLIISSLFAMILKYSEACISSDISDGNGGGMIFPIKNCFGRIGGSLSYLYAALALMLAFFMGGALQSVGGVGALSVSCGIKIGSLSLIFAIACVAFLLIYKDKIKSVTFALIPLITVTYIAFSLGVIILNIGKLPEIISTIFKSALNLHSIAGGSVGGAVSVALREGFSRGLLSNEAGAGTSSFSHSEVSSTPSGAGMLGICEVIFDTVILCPMTAFVILSVIPDVSEYTSGAELVISALRLSLGSFVSNMIAFCILLFAFSTVVCWFYYGKVCADYLRFPSQVYTAVFAMFLFFGGMISERLVVSFCDMILLVLTLLSGSVLIKSSDRIKRLSELSGLL
jgi:AGCS family alanine or glycine:cation symporter